MAEHSVGVYRARGAHDRPRSRIEPRVRVPPADAPSIGIPGRGVTEGLGPRPRPETVYTPKMKPTADAMSTLATPSTFPVLTPAQVARASKGSLVQTFSTGE